MFEILFKKIAKIVTLTEEETEAVKTFFLPKKIRKKQYLVQDGDSCKYLIFVEKGALRSYTVDEKGNEHIVQFAMEGWWVTDNNSFFKNVPSGYNIDALEDSEVLLINFSNYENMLLSIPAMERYFKILLQERLIALQRRIAITLTYSLEQKYIRMIDIYPDIIDRFPQHLIASYLGTTPETISRICKQLSLRK